MITGKIIEKLPASLKKKIENNMELRNIVGNVNWLTLENVFRSILGMFIYGWVAKYLGPDDLGLMSYSVAFVTLFATFSTLGLDDIVIRDLISKPEKRQEILSGTLLLKFLGSLMMIIISGVGILIIEKDTPYLKFFVLILAFGYVFKSFDVIDLWFRSKVQSQFSVYARSLSFIIISIIKIVLIRISAPLVAFIIVYSLDLLLIAVFLIFLYTRRCKEEKLYFKVDSDVVKKLLHDGLPLMMASFALTIESQIDQILLKNMIGTEELGIYSATLKIILSVAFLCSVIRNSFFPSIVSAKKKSKDLYNKKLMQLYQMMMITLLCLTIPIIIFRKPTVDILYGPEYSAVATLLPILVTRLFFTHYSTARSTFLLTENLTRYSFLTTVISTVLNIVLNIFLIPKYQSIGAIISSSISFFVNIFVIDLIYPKTRKNSIAMIKSVFNFYKLFL
jgi:PST family polysaccharide transporter